MTMKLIKNKDVESGKEGVSVYLGRSKVGLSSEEYADLKRLIAAYDEKADEDKFESAELKDGRLLYTQLID